MPEPSTPPRPSLQSNLGRKFMAARLSIPTTAQPPADPKTSFLDLAPPHWAARGLSWAVIAVFALGAIASVTISLPEKVTAQFTLVPVRGADPVKSTRGGVVVRVLAAAGLPRRDPAVRVRVGRARAKNLGLEFLLQLCYIRPTGRGVLLAGVHHERQDRSRRLTGRRRSALPVGWSLPLKIPAPIPGHADPRGERTIHGGQGSRLRCWRLRRLP